MPSLKELRIRIASVKSTQKITAAMKMVAASKLRRAQVAAEVARPYADRMQRMLGSLTASLPTLEGTPRLLCGSGGDHAHLLVVFTADRGLCGGFNGSIVRESRRRIGALRDHGHAVQLLCVGRKGRDALKREFGSLIIGTYEHLTRAGARFEDVRQLANRLTDMFHEGEFDVCTLIFNRFKSIISQEVTVRRVIPFPVPEVASDEALLRGPNALYIQEPTDDVILGELLPRNLAVQVFRALLESYASEQGARMTAMDNATRNAGEMIESLTLTYNRTRQAYITKELIEIISGAEAL